MMGILTRLRAARAMHSRRQVGERAAQVIDRVIFDMGVERLVQGTFRLDRHCRPRFSSVPLAPGRDGVAVALAQLTECAALTAAARRDADREALRMHTEAVVAGLLREFEARSPRFRALPAVPGA
ncbi:hypothetical protein [Massilia luteola]|uniref:hypothetical protein n=1 Tax=Massilia luteola TaxID=3081751 RepID=UPI002ACC1C53|nr:hypothetical protein [Massilia sp. Gc5]